MTWPIFAAPSSSREGAPVDAFRRDRCAYQQVIASESDHLMFSLFFHMIYSCPS